MATTDGARDEDGSLRVLAPMPEPDSDEQTPLLRRNGEAAADGSYAFEGVPWWRVPSVYWLAGPHFLLVVALGGTIVPKLNLILQLVCRHYYADQSVHPDHSSRNPAFALGDNGTADAECLDPAVQRRATSLMLAINLVIGLLSAAVVPQLGHLADRYGRTRIMALGACGTILAESATITIVKLGDAVDYRWLVLGAVFEGAAGSYLGNSLLGHSYVSDCTPPSRRGIAVGYLHACVFTGMAVGPVLAGWVVHATGSLLSVFYVALACSVFYGLFAALAVPESLSKKDQLESRERHARHREEARIASIAAATTTGSSSLLQRLRASSSSLSAAASAWNPLGPLAALAPRGPGTSRQLSRNLVSLAVINSILATVVISAWPVVILYSEYSFGWGNLEASVLMSSVSTVRVLLLLGIFPVINYLWRIRPARARARARELATTTTTIEKNRGADQLDIWLIRIAITSDAMGALGYTLAPSARLFFASGLLTAAGGLGTATIHTVVTKHMPSRRIGQLLGAFGILQALGRVLGPMAFNGVYYATLGTFPQAVFALMCASLACALVISLCIRPEVYLPDSGDEPRLGREDGEEALLDDPVIA